MVDIIKDSKIQTILQRYLNSNDIERLIAKLKSIKPELLFKTPLHGLYHSQKVLLFSYLIGKINKFNDVEMEILMDAAIYHDIGRTSDDNHNMHGFISSNRLLKDKAKYVSSDIYDDEINFLYLRSICDAHSLADDAENRIFDNYKYENPKMHKHIFTKLCHALKDADALDRTRMPNFSKASLDEKYLRYDISKSLITFASYVNSLYLQRDLEKAYQNYFGDYSRESLNETNCACFHGIGMDFFKLDSILQNGILSGYASKKLNIDMCKNFNGSNGGLWISVVDADMVHVNGDALNKYIKKGISFYCFVPKMRLESTSSNLLGDIKNKNEYNDEKYVFDKIDIDQIHSIVIANDILDQTIDKQNYLICGNNYDVIYSNIHHFRDEMMKRGFIDIDTTKIRQILAEYKEEVSNYEALPAGEQKLTQSDYFAKLDNMHEQMNKEIQIWMTDFYKYLLNTKTVPKVKDVMTYILKKYNIGNVISSKELNETVFILNEVTYVNGKEKVN